MWDYDLAKAIKTQPPNDFEREWYKATYSRGKWRLLGGQLEFSGNKVRYCYQAKWKPELKVIYGTYGVMNVELIWVERELEDGLTAWALFDKKQNGILILDVIG